MSTAMKLGVVLIVLICCVGCDQTTKTIAKAMLPDTRTVSVLGDTIRLQREQNEGAFLSLGASLPKVWRRILFTGGVGLFLLALLFYVVLHEQSSVLTVYALALVFAGGASNVLDRLMHGGRVFDFLNVGIGPVRTGIFNVADIFIMAGFFLLLWKELWGYRSTVNERKD